MCNLVCSCCEKDVCKCPNLIDNNMATVREWVNYCSVPLEICEITKTDSKHYKVICLYGWYFSFGRDESERFETIDTILFKAMDKSRIVCEVTFR